MASLVVRAAAGLIVLTAGVFACSSTTLVQQSAPVDGGGEDVPATEEADAEAPVRPPPTSTGSSVGDLCSPSKPCTGTGMACFTAGGPDGFCSNKCTKTSECSSGTCEQGKCFPSCYSERCPTGFLCNSLKACLPDCRKIAFCAASEVCGSDGFGCFAPEGACATPTTTASSGVTPSKTVGTATDAEKGALCAWAAGRYGGYGCKRTCDGGLSTTFAKDVTSCKAGLKATCTATVAQLEECFTVDSADPCAGAIATSAACAPLRNASCL